MYICVLKKRTGMMKDKEYEAYLTIGSSKQYEEKMATLVDGDKSQIRGELHGKATPYHMMYKLDGEPHPEGDWMRYEFLIEYSPAEPHVGIYYGVKMVSELGSDHEKAIETADRDWKRLKSVARQVLNNVFIDKNFTDETFRATNNAENHTYWPFWISLYEEEDIKEVALRALKLIRGVYAHYLEGCSFEGIGRDVKAYPVKEVRTRFTRLEYEKILDGFRRSVKVDDGKQSEKPAEIFNTFVERAIEAGWIECLPGYMGEIGFRYVGVPERNRSKVYDYEFPMLIKTLVELIRQKCLTEREQEMQLANDIRYGIPWQALSNIFLKVDGTAYDSDIMVNSIRGVSRAKKSPDFFNLLRGLLPEYLV